MGDRHARAGRPRCVRHSGCARQTARPQPADSAYWHGSYRCQGRNRCHIGEGIPRERFERISYAYADHAKIKDYIAGKADKLPATVNASADHVAQLAQKVYALIEKTHRYYSEIAERFADYDFQSITRAIGQLHAEEKLWQDPRGRMCIRGSAFAARPPEKP